MRYRTLDEMVSHFNREVSEMDIDQPYKIQLLGMVSAIAYGGQKSKWIPCKDCRYFCRELGTCTNLHGMYEPEYEGYCSYAERKKRCEE